jgi:hypothetical protein
MPIIQVLNKILQLLRFRIKAAFQILIKGNLEVGSCEPDPTGSGTAKENKMDPAKSKNQGG